MKEITKELIKDFKIKEKGYDFMGYVLMKGDIYTFHHLLIPNRMGGPYAYWNGVILCGKSSHPYLHLIESIDYDSFCYLTSEMQDMKVKGCLDTFNLDNIGNILGDFEYHYRNVHNGKGKRLIKDEYLRRKF